MGGGARDTDEKKDGPGVDPGNSLVMGTWELLIIHSSLLCMFKIIHNEKLFVCGFCFCFFLT